MVDVGDVGKVCRVGRVSGVFVWMTCQRRRVGNVVTWILLLLLLKYHPEGQNAECLLLKQKCKNVP